MGSVHTRLGGRIVSCRPIGFLTEKVDSPNLNLLPCGFQMHDTTGSMIKKSTIPHRSRASRTLKYFLLRNIGKEGKQLPNDCFKPNKTCEQHGSFWNEIAN